MTRVAELVASAVPSAVFVATASWAGVLPGLLAGGAVAAAVLVAALAGGAPVGRAVGPAVGVAVSAVIAAVTGSGAAMFLPDIWWSLAACALLTASVLAGYPLLGVAWSLARGAPMWWRNDPPSRRVLAAATAVAATVFGARFAVATRLYGADAVGWLATAKIAMGLPLTLCALGVAVWALRRVERRGAFCGTGGGPADAGTARSPVP